MKKRFFLMSMAALALVGVMTTGCSNEDEVIVENQSKNLVTLTTTISLDGGAQTRALDATGRKTFAAGDQIAVFYKNMSNKTAKAVSSPLTGIGIDISADGKRATITVKLSDPEHNGQLRFVYPASMAQTSIATNANIDDDNTVNFSRLNMQDGTLASLAGIDLAVYDGILNDKNLPTNAQLSNRLTIGEFTIKNVDGSSNLTNTISSLVVSDGANTYNVSPTAPATSFGDGPVYVAMRPVTDDKNISFVAANTTGVAYVKNVTGKTLVAGDMYPVNLKMEELVVTKNLASLTKDYEAQDGDVLTGALPAAYHLSIANNATVTLYNVSISDSGKPGITCNGNATLMLSGSNSVSSTNINYSGIDVPSGKTLTIGGVGSIVATGGNHAAGIGGGNKTASYNSCGNIRITSGTVTAIGGNNGAGGYGGAGIGGGYNSSCGDIEITGGTVTATGAQGGAGIGNGSGAVTCGNIRITSGTITATGGNYKTGGYGGAGIGGGDGQSAFKAIIIIGGTIVANGGNHAAGIGGGPKNASEIFSDYRTSVTITGGHITATAGSYAAGIGCGYDESYVSLCGPISINGATGRVSIPTTSKYVLGVSNNGTCPELIVDGFNCPPLFFNVEKDYCFYYELGSRVFGNKSF